jgi:hypothetical protein
MGLNDDQAIDLSRLMPDLWPDLALADEEMDAGRSAAWLQEEDPLVTRTLSDAAEPARPLGELMPSPVPATPPTLILAATRGRRRLEQVCLRIVVCALVAIIIIFLLADAWLLLAYYLFPRWT